MEKRLEKIKLLLFGMLFVIGMILLPFGIALFWVIMFPIVCIDILMEKMNEQKRKPL